MNDAQKLYNAAVQRLLEDRLIGESVRRVRLESALDRVERDFHFWQAETLMPSVVNEYVNNLGKRNG